MMLQPLEKWGFLLALCTLVGIAPAFAQVETATVFVDGMACPFCAFGIEKRLKKVVGVGSVEVDMAEGSAFLTAAEGGSIAFSEIPEAIRKAGFTPGAIHLTAVGSMAAESETQMLFKVGGTEQEMLLMNLSQEIRSQIVELPSDGGKVRLSGSLHLHADERPGIEPEQLEALAP